jgi:hypothetical protein
MSGCFAVAYSCADPYLLNGCSDRQLSTTVYPGHANSKRVIAPWRLPTYMDRARPELILFRSRNIRKTPISIEISEDFYGVDSLRDACQLHSNKWTIRPAIRCLVQLRRPRRRRIWLCWVVSTGGKDRSGRLKPPTFPQLGKANGDGFNISCKKISLQTARRLRHNPRGGRSVVRIWPSTAAAAFRRVGSDDQTAGSAMPR